MANITTCKHQIVDLSISFPRTISAKVTAGQVDRPGQVIEIEAANGKDTYGVGHGRLKIHCQQCGREDYWPAERPATWPKWARARLMSLARRYPELLSLVHDMHQSQLLMEYD